MWGIGVRISLPSGLWFQAVVKVEVKTDDRDREFMSWDVLLNEPQTYPSHLLLARSLLHMPFIM